MRSPTTSSPGSTLLFPHCVLLVVALGAVVLTVAAVSGTAITVAVLLPVGFLFLTLRVGITTLLLNRASDRARATTFSLMSIVLAGAQIIGTTGLAVLATSIGARLTLAVAGALLHRDRHRGRDLPMERSRWN
jgi:hypothetical protein